MILNIKDYWPAAHRWAQNKADSKIKGNGARATKRWVEQYQLALKIAMGPTFWERVWRKNALNFLIKK